MILIGNLQIEGVFIVGVHNSGLDMSAVSLAELDLLQAQALAGGSNEVDGVIDVGLVSGPNAHKHGTALAHDTLDDVMCVGAAAISPPFAIAIVDVRTRKLGQINGRIGAGVDMQGHLGGRVGQLSVVGSGTDLEGVPVVHGQGDVPGVLVDVADALSVLGLHLGDIRLGGGGSHCLQVDLQESAQGVGLGADQEVDNVGCLVSARAYSPACVAAGDEFEEGVGICVIFVGSTGCIFKKFTTSCISGSFIVVQHSPVRHRSAPSLAAGAHNALHVGGAGELGDPVG